MANIAVLGGTGYSGSNIVNEAAGRGHRVVSLSRSAPSASVAGVDYSQGSASDPETVKDVITGTDVVVGALSPKGDLAGNLVATYRAILGPVADAGARLVVVGGFTATRPAPGEQRFIDAGAVAPEFAASARETADVLELLLAEAPEDLDWLYVSPGRVFGSFAPGERRGQYRVSGDIALFDSEGTAAIGGEDFALAVVDEIEKPTSHRAHIHFAY